MNETLNDKKDEIINDLNMQIERGLKTQINLRESNEELRRQCKSLEYALNGFFKDGINSIYKNIEKKVNEFFSSRSIMDTKYMVLRNDDDRIFMVLDDDVYNHDDFKKRYVLFADADYTPQVMEREKFRELFTSYKDLSESKKNRGSKKYEDK